MGFFEGSLVANQNSACCLVGRGEDKGPPWSKRPASSFCMQASRLQTLFAWFEAARLQITIPSEARRLLLLKTMANLYDVWA